MSGIGYQGTPGSGTRYREVTRLVASPQGEGEMKQYRDHLYIVSEGTGVDAIELPPIADPVGFRRAIETAKGMK